MKLWLRQTLLLLAIILASVSACLYFFVALQTKNLLDTALQDGENSVNAFIGHLSTLDATGRVTYDADDATRCALIQYTFSVYAHILQNEKTSYALSRAGEYLYNVSPLNVMARLPLRENEISAVRMESVEGTPWLMSARRYTVLETPVTVCFARDITDVYAAIDNLARAAQLALVGCLMLSGAVLPLALRRTLKPLGRLTRATERIAGGQYALRSGVQSGDEVGELSRSFDRMADTVEQKILSLEDTAKRRELLLGALTHEMKTPMTAIIGFSDSLLTMPLSEEERLEAAHEIHEAAVRTERLSQKMMQLISMTDCPALALRALRVDALFSQVRQAIAPQLDAKGITLQTDARLTLITGDSDLLISLLTNLIDNAAKASKWGDLIKLTAFARGEESCLCVIDQGGGIPKDKIALVTEPFYRVDKARSRRMGGAGLGLTLCSMIAQAHGGRLEIESEWGKGTRICLCLPGITREDNHENAR